MLQLKTLTFELFLLRITQFSSWNLLSPLHPHFLMCSCICPGAGASSPGCLCRARSLRPGLQLPSTRAGDQLTADSEGTGRPRICSQLAAASLSQNPLLGLLQSFQQPLNWGEEKKEMPCKREMDWFADRKGSPTC